MKKISNTLTNLLAPYSTYYRSDTQVQRVFKYSPRYRLAFSLLNEDATSGSGAMAWDAHRAIQSKKRRHLRDPTVPDATICVEHISPLLNKLSVLHNFTIESQVQFHAPLAFEPRSAEHEGRRVHGLTHEDLTVFVNSAEWTLCKWFVSFGDGALITPSHSIQCIQRSRNPLRSLRPLCQPQSPPHPHRRQLYRPVDRFSPSAMGRRCRFESFRTFAPPLPIASRTRLQDVRGPAPHAARRTWPTARHHLPPTRRRHTRAIH